MIQPQLTANNTAGAADKVLLHPPPPPPTDPPQQNTTVSSGQIAIIVLAVVLTLAIVTCIISHYKMGARSWSDRQRRQQATAIAAQTNAEASPQPEQANAATALYLPSALQERIAREQGELRDRQVRLQSAYKDTELGLPVSVALPDELPFDPRQVEQERETCSPCIRPPPNRTVFDSYAHPSPPPYRADSIGRLSIATTTSSLGSSGPPPYDYVAAPPPSYDHAAGLGTHRIVRDWVTATHPLVSRHRISSSSSSSNVSTSTTTSNADNNNSTTLLPPDAVATANTQTSRNGHNGRSPPDLCKDQLQIL